MEPGRRNIRLEVKKENVFKSYKWNEGSRKYDREKKVNVFKLILILTFIFSLTVKADSTRVHEIHFGAITTQYSEFYRVINDDDIYRFEKCSGFSNTSICTPVQFGPLKVYPKSFLEAADSWNQNWAMGERGVEILGIAGVIACIYAEPCGLLAGLAILGGGLEFGGSARENGRKAKMLQVIQGEKKSHISQREFEENLNNALVEAWTEYENGGLGNPASTETLSTDSDTSPEFDFSGLTAPGVG